MGRPLSLRIGGSRAALGSRLPGGLAGEPGARIAVGVGVVVSAFRLTPFFCRGEKKRRQPITPGPLHSKPFPLPTVPNRSQIIYLYLGKGLSRGSCRYSKERGSSRMQRLEKGRRNDRWMGNVEDSGRYLRWWSI